MMQRFLRLVRTLGARSLVLSALLLTPGALQAQAPCGTTTWTLTAGQTIQAGTVTVSNDLENLYLTYTLTYPGATFGTLHAWVGNDLLNVPQNSQGVPIPGQFPYTQDATGATTWTITVPFADLLIQDTTKVCGTNLYVVTHAEVAMDGDGDGSMDHETAFGGPNPGGTSNRWWFYGTYTICCDFGPPPVESCSTAYGKGGHVFTTDRKSNPEGLPTLGLTRNRWGWASLLATPGTYTSTLWAGAALNHTDKGVAVGTVTVLWDGTSATVTYTLFATGYHLKEIHIYAGDDAPTTIAPGQYGNTDHLFGYETSTTRTIPLSDTNGGGVWIVSHAVVCR